MKKMTSRDRRAEERRILAEMDEAMAKQKSVEQPQPTAPKKKKARPMNHYDDSMPQKVHCKRNALLNIYQAMGWGSFLALYSLYISSVAIRVFATTSPPLGKQ